MKGLTAFHPSAVRTIERAPLSAETVVAAGAMLVAYAIALVLERIGHRGAGLGVQAVVLALMMARSNRRHASDLPPAATVVVVAAVSLCAVQIGTLLNTHPNAGDALFVAGVSLPIWVRRFGPQATVAGAYATLPFVGVLMIPAPAREAHPSVWWVTLIAVVACLSAMAADRAAVAAGLLERPPPRPVPRHRRSGSWRRPLASTRMAIHMGLAVGAAFVLGRVLFGAQHWGWVVVSALIVCSGARGRANVAHKAVLRLAGAAAGTVAATLLAGVLGPGEPLSVVAIFVVLVAAIELRRRSYAFWAVGITTVLALLYGYFGQAGTDLLDTRLLGVLLGAALGAAASWFVMPVRTRDVALVRLGAALRALGPALEHPDDASARAALRQTVREVDEIARPYELQRAFGRGGHARVAEAIDALRSAARRVEAREHAAAADVDALRATVHALMDARRA